MGKDKNDLSADIKLNIGVMNKKSKTRTMLYLFLLISISLMAQPSILGRWNTGQENTIIEIKETAGKIEGRIVTSDHTKVPIGRIILKDVYRVNQNFKGKLYSLRKNKWFDAEFSPKQEKIEVAITVGWVTREINWKKTY